MGWPITRRLLGEVAIPVLCGLAWGILAYYQGETPFKSASTGFAAFFFIFFLQGQVLRVAKNVGDKQNAEEWRTQFASIQDGLDQLKKQQAAPATVHVPAARVKVRTHAPTVRVSNKSEYFLESARKSFASDFYHPAALTAAMAFEAAAREAGLRLGLPENRPMTELVRNIAAVEGDPQLEQTLLTLVRLRNNLVHPSPSSEAVSAEKAQQLIEAFADGIKRLETAWPQ
jgi:HEPN domain-containing protein